MVDSESLLLGQTSELDLLPGWMESYEEMERNAKVKLYYHRISTNGMSILHASRDNVT